MSIKIESTTDTPEAVTAALGNLAPKEESVETKVETQDTSASEKTDEKELSESETDTSESDETEETDSDEEAQDDKPKKKSKSGFKRRIDKLNARISQYEKELAELRQVQTQKPSEEPKENKSTDSAPDPDNFDTISAYTAAVTKWTLEQERKAQKAQEQEQKAKEEQETLVKEHNKRVEKYAKENPAFKEAITSAIEILGADYDVNPTLEYEMLSSEFSHLILAELASDLDEFDRINALPANKIAREIGKLEAKLALSKEEKSETKKTTKAPAPLKTLGNKSTGLSTKSPDEMDFHEYKKWREANA